LSVTYRQPVRWIPGDVIYDRACGGKCRLHVYPPQPFDERLQLCSVRLGKLALAKALSDSPQPLLGHATRRAAKCADNDAYESYRFTHSLLKFCQNGMRILEVHPLIKGQPTGRKNVELQDLVIIAAKNYYRALTILQKLMQQTTQRRIVSTPEPLILSIETVN
jgi:hypothetical protein